MLSLPKRSNWAFLFIFVIIFSSCSSTRKLAISAATSYLDTIPFSKNSNGHIVIPLKVNGFSKLFIFDTGASKCVVVDSSIKKTNNKILIRDIHGKLTIENSGKIDSLKISRTLYKDVYSIPKRLPAIFKIDGLLGYNVIAASNWQITPQSLLVSSKPFLIQSKVSIPFFENGGAMHAKISFNNAKSETYLIDSGSDFDIKITEGFYRRNQGLFQTDSVHQNRIASYGANGGQSLGIKTLKCNIIFEGMRIPNVNISVVKGVGNSLGMAFFNRFKEVAINSSTKQICFGQLKSDTRKKVD